MLARASLIQEDRPIESFETDWAEVTIGSLIDLPSKINLTACLQDGGRVILGGFETLSSIRQKGDSHVV